MPYRDKLQAENEHLKAYNAQLQENLKALQAKIYKPERWKRPMMRIVHRIPWYEIGCTMGVITLCGAFMCLLVAPAYLDHKAGTRKKAVCIKACKEVGGFIGVDYKLYVGDVLECTCIPKTGKNKVVRAAWKEQ